MAMIVTFTLPMAPSVNHMYFNTKYGRTLTKAAKDFKDSAILIARVATRDIDISTTEHFGLIIDVYSKNSRRDATNVVKIVEDCIFEAINVNDNRNVFILVRKFFNGNDTIVVHFGDVESIKNAAIAMI